MNDKSEKASFKLELLNNLRAELTPFAQRVTGMCTKKLFKLLALYITVVQHSEDFIHHLEHYHDKDGFTITGDSVRLSDIEALGGSYEELNEFRSDVLNSFNTDSPETPKSRKRKDDSSEEHSTVKMSKKSALIKKEQEELLDPEGLEAKYRKNYVGLVKIHINNLEVHSELNNLVLDEKVKKVKSDIRCRYDPSQGNSFI